MRYRTAGRLIPRIAAAGALTRGWQEQAYRRSWPAPGLRPPGYTTEPRRGHRYDFSGAGYADHPACTTTQLYFTDKADTTGPVGPLVLSDS